MYSFSKAERICSKLVIDKLFAGGNTSMAAYPLRAVYMPVEKSLNTPVSILISVPKRRFHHAVDRNSMKRQVREAYRLNKSVLWNSLEGKTHGLAIAFICIADKPCTSEQVTRSVKKLLRRIEENLHSIE
jgi:ribonuclease P protein component